MEEFRKKLRARAAISIVVIIVLGIFVSLDFAGQLTPLQNGENWQDFWHGMVIGFSVGAQIAFLVYVIRTAVTLSSPERLKARYIADNDEREQLIKAKAGANSYWFEMVGLMLGILIGGYFNMAVSITCFCAGVFIILVRIVLTLYYRAKY